MHPILFTVGPITLYAYGLMLVVAVLVSTWLASRAARRLPASVVAVPAERILDVVCWLLLGGLVGARAFYVLLEWEWYVQAPLEIFAIWHGGLVWYGGFLGTLVTGWIYVRVHQAPYLRVADQLIPFLALGHGLGRLGCFLNGCCYGQPTTLWCGMLFPGHLEPRLPTQLFEAIGLFILYGVLRAYYRPSVLHRVGQLFGCYLIGYGGLRFSIEFLRGDQVIGWAGLTVQQWISLLGMASGMFFIVRAHGQDLRVSDRKR